MKRIAIIENSEGLGAFFTGYLEEGEYQLFPVWKNPEFPDVENFDAFIITPSSGCATSITLPIRQYLRLSRIRQVRSMPCALPRLDISST